MLFITLNSQFSTLNSQFSTLNSQFSTLNLNDSLVVVYNLSVKQIDNSVSHHSVVL